MSQVDFTLEDVRGVVSEFVEESEFRIVKTMKECFDRYDERFDRVDQRFDAMDQRFDAMDQRFDQMDDRLIRVEGQLSKVAEDVTSIKRLGGQHSQEIMELKARPA